MKFVINLKKILTVGRAKYSRKTQRTNSQKKIAFVATIWGEEQLLFTLKGEDVCLFLNSNFQLIVTT